MEETIMETAKKITGEMLVGKICAEYPEAIRRIFDTRIPPFSSVKAFIGHTLGASEGIEAVYSVLSIRHGLIYPNLNFHLSDEESGLIPETVFRSGLPIRHVLSNSFGFGGNNSSLVFSTLNR